MKKTPRLAVKLDTNNAMLRRFGPYMLCGLVTLLVIVLYLDNHRWLASCELGIQDSMVSLGRKPTPPDNLVIVNIDNSAIDKLGPWPWDSERLGYLVGMLAEYHPKAIGLDLELPTDVMEDPEGNLFLADMIERAGTVVLPLRFTLAMEGRLNQTAPKYMNKSRITVIDEAARLFDYPYPQSLSVTAPFTEAAIVASGVGHVNTWQDIDGIIRRDPLIVNYEGHYYPSMALQLARMASGVNLNQVKIKPGESVRLGTTREIPTDDAGMLRVDYRGPSGTIPSVSAARVLEGESLTGALSDRIVIVGISASGYGTGLNTSVSSDLPRSEKLATVTANIMDGRFITTVTLSQILDLIILCAMGVFCALVLPRVSLTNRMIVLVGVGFLFLNLNYVLYHSFKLLTNTVYPTLQILIFLGFAPFIKSHNKREEYSPRPVPKVAVKQPEHFVAPRLTKSTPTSTRVETVAVASTSGGAQATVAIGSDKTVAMSASGATEVAVPTSSDSGITLTPSFAPEVAQPLGSGPADFSGSFPPPVDLGGVPSSLTPPSTPILMSDDLKRLGRYEILGVLGQGAMGTVYKGKDPAIDRLVALKTIRVGTGIDAAQTAEFRERLVREAKAAGKLSHPNIVTIYDVGTEGDLNYIAMEYLEGQPLEALVQKSTTMNFRIIAKMLQQTCAALDYAHKAGIVHRDVKPANIMVLENYEIKVTDFGIARFESGGMSMTQTGIAMGTPYYIAPEQLRGEQVDRRCDIFSLGVVAYELLTRKRPFDGANISALIFAITQTNPDPPSRLDSSIPGLLDMVIGKALAKDPRKRYQTAEEMGNDLAAFAQDLAGAKAYRR